jgi:hypothetical protein
MDLIEWLLSQGAKVRKGGQEYCINCPKCGDVKKHLYVNPYLGVAHCFRCGYSGVVAEVLMEGFKLPLSRVRELIHSFKKLGSNVSSFGREKVYNSVAFPEGSVELTKVGKGVERLLQEWCKEANISYTDLVNMKCRWWRGRLVVPCWKDRQRKELWYWIARILNNTEPKYINCSAPKSEVLWGVDWYDVSGGYLYVCEGWKDAYRMKGIALLGKEISDKQISLVLMLAKDAKVRVLLDVDAWREGVMVGIKLCKVIGYDKVEVGFLLGLKDPGEGRDMSEVLNNTLFLGLSDGAGKVIEAMKSLVLKRVDVKFEKLKVPSEGTRGLRYNFK